MKKVVFELDPSFVEPLRTCDKPPYEVHEVGWGQFAIGIKLIFHDPSCRPVEVLKDLILFDDMQPSPKRPIVNEDYNELVFVEPSAHMFNLLTNPVPVRLNIVEKLEDPETKEKELEESNASAANDKGEEEKKEEIAENGI